MVHRMRLHAEPFERMKNRQKTSELRLNDEKRRAINVGDSIEFTSRINPDDKITVEVTYLKAYPSFKDLFYGVKLDYPGWEEEKFVHGMYEYYTAEDEKKYGALEIGVKLLRN